MTPGKFLRLLWPATGFYCIAHPFKPAGSPVTVYAHKVFDNISAAVTHVLESKHQADTYFAVLSLKAEKIWDPDKEDYKTRQKGAYAVRKHANMAESKCAFFDLDVGPDAHKYPTRPDALQALETFLATTKLPRPLLVSSGGGVHVYWPFDKSIPAEEWGTIALNMKQLAAAVGLKVDTQRTTDSSSVLRVPDTFNWKDRSNPRPVSVLDDTAFAITPVDQFRKLVTDALIIAGVTPGTAPPPRAAKVDDHGLGSNMVFNDFGPPPTLGELASSCAQVQEILRSQGEPAHPHYGQLDNTAWYKGMISTIKHVEDGDNWCRKLTNLFPRSVADIDAKLLQLEQFAPARCETLQTVMPWGETPCLTCRFKNDPTVPNPFAASRKSVKAPPPAVQLIAPGAGVQAALIPNPPKPYERLKTGAVARTSKDKDGNETTEIIYPHDLYPIRRLVNADENSEQQTWRVHLPRVGAKEFVIDADVLYDGRKFCAALSHSGIYPHKANIPYLQDYMVAYISQLQRDIDADHQISHLGWDDEHRQFVLPDKTLMHDGTVKATSLTTAAQRATVDMTKKGTLQAQVNLMAFYNHDDYLPNQSAILGSLASVLFYMTGHHGIVVNMSGDAGASKSTTLYAGAANWGHPKLWPLNGTNRGATANARLQRIATNANLPTMMDEITHMPVKEAQDLVMSVTQPGHRVRLNTSGIELKPGGGYKSAIMLSTANSSLHSLLSIDNAAGTAGSMRVFEMRFAAQKVHTKAQADEFLRQLEQNHGHIGEQFAAFVVKNREAVERRVQQVMREIDTEARITSGERFWSAYIACVVVAGEICEALGLLPYNTVKIRNWLVNRQVPYMRGVIKEEYRDPLAVLTDYIAQSHGGILMVERAGGLGANTATQPVAANSAFSSNHPHGALLGHYDRTAGVLYLLKQGFKDHCNRVGANATRIVEELATPRALATEAPTRIITEKSIRRTLGAGTEMAKGQSWCFAVDMKHQEISGHVNLTVLNSAPQSAPTAPVGNLKAVP